MTNPDRAMEMLEATRADLARLQGLDGMAADVREINRDLAAFAARRTRSRLDGPVA